MSIVVRHRLDRVFGVYMENLWFMLCLFDVLSTLTTAFTFGLDIPAPFFTPVQMLVPILMLIMVRAKRANTAAKHLQRRAPSKPVAAYTKSVRRDCAILQATNL
jgi:hypothetical protein